MESHDAIEYQFDYLVALLGGRERIERLAREHGAFVRSRKVTCATDLLRLLMIWSVAGHSLEETAALAAESEIADVSDVALLKRFRSCREWIGALLGDLLSADSSHGGVPYRMRLLDATTVAKPGSKGTDHRVHLSYSINEARIDGAELTSAKGGETLKRFSYTKNDLVIGDRGYAHRNGIEHVVNAEAFYVIRVNWQNMPLEDRDGNALEILPCLRALSDTTVTDLPVQIRFPSGVRHACRLIALRKTEPAAEAARQKLLKQRRSEGASVGITALEAAGYFIVLTNLPIECTPTQILELYKLRWQIEMKFKRMKSIIGLHNLPVRDAELAQTYLMTKILAVLVIDQLVNQYDSFSPWGYPITTTSSGKPVAA
jgi:hypothetical protein